MKLNLGNAEGDARGGSAPAEAMASALGANRHPQFGLQSGGSRTFRAFASSVVFAAALGACGDASKAPDQAAQPSGAAEKASSELDIYRSGRLGRLVVTGANTVEPAAASGGSEGGQVVRSTGKALFPQGDGNAVAVFLPDDVRRQISGNIVRITVRARAARANGAPEFRVFYSRPGVTASDWSSFRLTPDFQDLSFQFAVPSDLDGAYAPDLVGVWADPEGLGRGVEISAVTVRPTAGPSLR